MIEFMATLGHRIQEFVYYYPLFMAYLWMIGAVHYFLRFEYRSKGPAHPPKLASYPLVTVVVPCHNEADNVAETISRLELLHYPHYEIIAVNDGSTDGTGEILEELARGSSRLRVIHLATNQGKAMGLRMAAMVSRGEYLVCIDGDAILDPHAITWMMMHFLSSPRVGAVTGNPRIRTRSTLLGKIQVGEFSAIVGLIKRAQRIYGRVFTVSGVVSAFRKAALQQVGYWSLDMVTEDIDISWKLQLNHWDVRFEPHALCWILMPETLRGLWRQRLRWAQGGHEVLMRYFGDLKSWRSRRMWPVYLEYFASIFWAYSMLTIFAIWAVAQLLGQQESGSLIPAWPGIVLGMTCLLQFAVGMALDCRYEGPGLARSYYVMIWYPLFFWLLSMLTTVFALPKAIAKSSGERAVWSGSDRGLR